MLPRLPGLSRPGAGWPPYNARGWAWITFSIHPFALSKSGATMVADYPDYGAHPSIAQLPVRLGERARLGGIAPHRQLSQHAPEETCRVRRPALAAVLLPPPRLLTPTFRSTSKTCFITPPCRTPISSRLRSCCTNATTTPYSCRPTCYSARAPPTRPISHAAKSATRIPISLSTFTCHRPMRARSYRKRGPSATGSPSPCRPGLRTSTPSPIRTL